MMGLRIEEQSLGPLDCPDRDWPYRDWPYRERPPELGVSMLEVIVALAIFALTATAFLGFAAYRSQQAVPRFAEELKLFIDQAAELARSADESVTVQLGSEPYPPADLPGLHVKTGLRIRAELSEQGPRLNSLAVPPRIRVQFRFGGFGRPNEFKLHPAGDSPGSVLISNAEGITCSIIQSLHAGRRTQCTI